MKRSFIALMVLFLVCACQKFEAIGKSAVGDEIKAENTKSNDGWISSGGELVRDGANPWWLENTTEVKYCIHVDVKTVSVGEDQIKASLEKALNFWKRQFALQRLMIKRDAPYLDRTNVKIATQSFTPSCDNETLLHVYVGYGALGPKEAAFLGDPNRIVSHAVRTKYDPKEMRGEGYLYVSSDLGEQRFNREDKYSEGIYQQDSAILDTVLMHEAGHLFGLQDEGSGNTLMSLRYIENLVGNQSMFQDRINEMTKRGQISSLEFRKFAAYLPDLDRLSLAGRLREDRKGKKIARVDVDFQNPFYKKALRSYVRAEVGQWLGQYPPTSFVVPPTDYYVRNVSVEMETFLELNEFGGHHLSVRKPENGQYLTLDLGDGMAVRPISQLKYVLEEKELVVVYLPPEQTVFKVASKDRRILRSPRLELRGRGDYTREDGTKLPVYFKMGTGPNDLEMYSFGKNGKIDLVKPQLLFDPAEAWILSEEGEIEDIEEK